MEHLPKTAREIVLGLKERFRPEKCEQDTDMTFHLDFSGDTGGLFTVAVKDLECTVNEGHVGESTCTISAKASDYEDIELGRVNPQMAFMMGKIKATNVMALMQFITFFRKLVKPAL
ncbi:MAG: SCP2 sterol-binding domain-containing protein [Bacteroidota bacterium]